MNKTTGGWIIFVAAMGMMFSMLAVDIASLMEWAQMTTPVFVGTALGHVAATIAAFVGGKLIPETRDPGMQTRSSDPKPDGPPVPGQIVTETKVTETKVIP